MELGLKVEKNMIEKICHLAKQASYELVCFSDEQIRNLLSEIAQILEEHIDEILHQNHLDIQNAREHGINEVMVDRLLLTKERIVNIAHDVRKVRDLPSPVGIELESEQMYNGIQRIKKTVPFGVVAMIYESRPNVTVDAAVIALKSKNSIVLKGGKEAIRTNTILSKLLKRACQNQNIPADVIGFIESTDRQETKQLLEMKAYIDVLIPRGSAKLIQWVTIHAQVPVIETGAGNCHLFIDETADFDMALTIIENAKTQRPSVCNAVEKILVHQSIASRFLPKLVERLADQVQFHVDISAQDYFESFEPMSNQERYEEYLDYILGVIVVSDVKEAVSWMNTYGSHHSDGIVSSDEKNVVFFQNVVDSAAIYHNASTRFTDGGEFGFGAEIGIATSKLHARGPMALKEMTTYKYLLIGDGQIRN